MCSSCDSPPVVGCVCVSPTFGKLSDIMPMSIHASLIRNSLSVPVVTYVTWCVSRYFRDWFFPDSLRMTVPRIWYPICLLHASSCLLRWDLYRKTPASFLVWVQAVSFGSLCWPLHLQMHLLVVLVSLNQTARSPLTTPPWITWWMVVILIISCPICLLVDCKCDIESDILPTSLCCDFT